MNVRNTLPQGKVKLEQKTSCKWEVERICKVCVKLFPSYNPRRQRARRESPNLQHSDPNHIQLHAIRYQKDIGKLEGIQENIVKQLEGLIYKERLK